MKNILNKTFKDIKTVNGEEVVQRGLSSEHKEYGTSYAGYAWLHTVSGKDYYYPVMACGKYANHLIGEPVWNFIKESGLPNITFY